MARMKDAGRPVVVMTVHRVAVLLTLRQRNALQRFVYEYAPDVLEHEESWGPKAKNDLDEGYNALVYAKASDLKEVYRAINSLSDEIGYEDDRLMVLRDLLDPLPDED